MKPCMTCKREVRLVEPLWGLCQECYSSAKELKKLYDTSMARAVVILGEELRNIMRAAEEAKATELCLTCRRKVNEVEMDWCSCKDCFERAKDMSRRYGITMDDAMRAIEEEYRRAYAVLENEDKAPKKVNKQKASEDEQVNIKRYVEPNSVAWKTKDGDLTITKRVTSEDYRELEYEFLNVDAVNFVNREDEVQYCRQLLDIALLGGDIEWAKQLNDNIKRIKGTITDHGTQTT